MVEERGGGEHDVPGQGEGGGRGEEEEAGGKGQAAEEGGGGGGGEAVVPVMEGGGLLELGEDMKYIGIRVCVCLDV